MTGSPAPSSQPAEPPASSDARRTTHAQLLRPGWVGIAQVAAIAAIAVGAAIAVYGERATLRAGFHALRGISAGWLAAGIGAELLVNWVADVACLVCAIKAVREPVPWATILVIWSAGVGAASFSPVPAGLGIVDIVLIAALASAGLHGTAAVAAVLVYRLIALKVLISLGWITFHYVTRRRQANKALNEVPRRLRCDKCRR